MEIKKIKRKQLCPHKIGRNSMEKRISEPRTISQPHRHSKTRDSESLMKELQN